jgi:hypothetical protein
VQEATAQQPADKQTGASDQRNLRSLLATSVHLLQCVYFGQTLQAVPGCFSMLHKPCACSRYHTSQQTAATEHCDLQHVMEHPHTYSSVSTGVHI